MCQALSVVSDVGGVSKLSHGLDEGGLSAFEASAVEVSMDPEESDVVEA